MSVGHGTLQQNSIFVNLSCLGVNFFCRILFIANILELIIAVTGTLDGLDFTELIYLKKVSLGHLMIQSRIQYSNCLFY